MADMKFACPSCGQHITCDELWGGHQIQCPACQGPVMVPPKAAPAAQAATPTPPPPQSVLSQVPQPVPSKLSLSAARGAHPAAGGQTAPRSIPIRNLVPPPPKKKSPLVKYLVVVVVLAALGAGAVIGWPYLAALQDKANAKRREAEKNSDGGEVGHIAELHSVLDATDPDKGGGLGQRDLPPAPAETAAMPEAGAPAAAAASAMASLPAVPAKYTLEVAQGKIPEGRLNGMISGAKFMPENARIDQAGAAQVLRFMEGQIASPDREVLIYLHIKPGETVSGQKITISKDMRGSGVPQVMKRWKTNPRYAPQQKSFSSGYAMKLELGQLTNGILPGKIFLALPDTEQSVLGGVFQANSSLREGAAEGGLAQPATPTAVPTAGSMTPAERAAFQKRYGIAPQ